MGKSAKREGERGYSRGPWDSETANGGGGRGGKGGWRKAAERKSNNPNPVGWGKTQENTTIRQNLKHI